MPVLMDGEVVRDTYRVERKIGEGAFAEVYRVQHRFLGRQAMKVLKDEGAELEDIERMLSEAVLLSKIGHPNIIRVFDANILEKQGCRYGFFTMEYVPGGSLDHYWQSYRNALMPVKEAVEIIKQVCSGIAVAHSENPPIVHRDIKPQNILVGYDGTGLRVRVGDFGLAKRVNPLTMLASARGTLSFKPPESFDNMDSPAADVWALGTTLYLILTDTLPYPELADRDVRSSHDLLRPLRPAAFYNATVDVELDRIVARCLAVNASERYVDARELGRDLHRWQASATHSHSSRSLAPADESSKSALGMGVNEDKSEEARQMVIRALELSKQPENLVQAADLLEQALTKLPSLRQQHEPQLRLWRRGICM